jgi:hypothetical protein
MVAHKGAEWNKAAGYRAAGTLRRVRRVTRAGLYNQTQTSHSDVGGSADGQCLVFAAAG